MTSSAVGPFPEMSLTEEMPMNAVATSIPNSNDLIEYNGMNKLARIERSGWFVHLIFIAIVVTGALSGLETYSVFRGEGPFGPLLDWLQSSILMVFMAEVIVKVGSFGTRPWRYFQLGWNSFDFVILVLCLLPLDAECMVVFRLLRMLRLFTALQGLQVLISGLLRGIPSLGYIGLLLMLVFYIYAVIGTVLFGGNDPVRFGTLHTTMLTLFQLLTLEGWNEMLAAQYHGSEVAYDEAWKQLAGAGNRVSVARPVAAAAYFISFILIGTMIMLNLFTGVIIRSMEEAHTEAVKDACKHRFQAHGGHPMPADEMRALSVQLSTIARRLAEIEFQQELTTRTSSGRASKTEPWHVDQSDVDGVDAP